MESFAETERALAELSANRDMLFGLHERSELKAGVPGRYICEVPFDPAIHEPTAINPLSIWEEVTGEPHVVEVLPHRPISLNVILHQDPIERNLKDYLQPVRTHKRTMASGLRQALVNSIQQGDITNLYIVGDTEIHKDIKKDAKIVEGTESPEEASRAIADICAKGLTFVISDFNRLAFNGGHKKKAFENTVAVKANHKLEVEFPADVGRITQGGLKEVNTDKPKELKAANEEQALKHQRKRDYLGGVGMSVVEVLFDNKTKAGFDIRITDDQIAKKVRKFATK